jgi:hypothetical protein
VNTFLSANGSAFSFTSLGATSNFPGVPGPGDRGGLLSEEGKATSSGSGNTTITITTVLSGYTAPTGTFASLVSRDSGSYTGTTAGDAQTSSSSFNGLNTPPLTIPSLGPQPQSFSSETGALVGTVTSGYTLGTSVTLTFTSGSDDFSVNAELGHLIPTPPPQPPTLTLLATGAFGLIGYGRRRRKQAAS